MRTPAWWLALLLVVAAVAPASALAAAPADGAPDPSDATPAVDAALDNGGLAFQTDDAAEAPDTVVEISLREDRSAFWRVEAHYALETQNETRAFRTVAEQYESGEADIGPDAVLFETIRRQASEATGREMALGNVTYHSSVDESGDRGTLALTFRWTNFLRAGENGTLILDDAFRLPTAEEDRQRTWLSIFDENQEIRIRPPEGYTVTSTSIPVQQRENAVVLAEPSDFEGESALRITYTPVGPTGQFPAELLAGLGVVAVVAVAAGVWTLRRRPGGGATGDTSPDPGDTPAASDPIDGADEATGAEATGGASAAGESADTDSDDEDVDLSLLSDEEQVERLLERNDGRMKQATIVDEMGWSDAKVSQLLSAMADEGRIDKLRLGRENLISLPDDADEDTEE